MVAGSVGLFNDRTGHKIEMAKASENARFVLSSIEVMQQRTQIH